MEMRTDAAEPQSPERRPVQTLITEARGLAHQLLALVGGIAPPAASPDRLTIRAAGRVVFVEIDRIDWVEADGNYAWLHAGDQSFRVRETMTHLLRRLGEDRFHRIHRSRLVNLARIRELWIAGGGDYDVVLENGRRLKLSRLTRAALQARLARL